MHLISDWQNWRRRQRWIIQGRFGSGTWRDGTFCSPLIISIYILQMSVNTKKYVCIHAHIIKCIDVPFINNLQFMGYGFITYISFQQFNNWSTAKVQKKFTFTTFALQLHTRPWSPRRRHSYREILVSARESSWEPSQVPAK